QGDHAALLQRRREIPGQGRGRDLDQIAGASLRGQAAPGRPGSEDVLHERLPAADEPDARLQVVNYADLHVGLAFRSPGRTITEADVVAFAGLTGDYSELHTSEVYGKASQFGRRVAHGMLGLAVRRPDLPRRHDLRELPDRRAARQRLQADAGDRDVRRRRREPGRRGRTARKEGAAGVEGAAGRRRGVEAMNGTAQSGVPIRIARVT